MFTYEKKLSCKDDYGYYMDETYFFLLFNGERTGFYRMTGGEFVVGGTYERSAAKTEAAEKEVAEMVEKLNASRVA
jgi:hypothetical protein